MIRICPLSPLAPGESVRVEAHAAAADSVTLEEGSVESGSLLAVYRQGDVPVGVLAMNQPRLFGRWRRQLNAATA